MSANRRCARCLSWLPPEAQACPACGAALRAPRRSLVALALVGLIAGVGAWWLRGAAGTSSTPPSIPQSTPIATPELPGPASKEGGESDGSAHPQVPSSMDPVDGGILPAGTGKEELIRLARATLPIEARDAAGLVLRGATGFLIDGEGHLLVPLSVTNGAAALFVTWKPGQPAIRVEELAVVDPRGAALITMAAAAGTSGVPLAPPPPPAAPATTASPRPLLFALLRPDKEPPFTVCGRLRAAAPSDGLELEVLAPCANCFVADEAGRLVGLAGPEAASSGLTVALVPAATILDRLAYVRPTTLTAWNAGTFDRDGAARRERATCYVAAREFIPALENFLAAIELEPRLRDECAKATAACMQLALREARVDERLAEVLPLLERAAHLLDRDPIVLHACGLALLDLGDAEAALPLLVRALDISGSDSGDLREAARAAYLHVGELARSEQRPGDAVAVLEEGLARFREDVVLLKSLGFAYYELGNRERARDVLEKVASLDAGEARELSVLLANLAPEPSQPRAGMVEIRFDPASGSVRSSVRLNDKLDVTLLVDTGATLTTISEAVATRLKIDFKRSARRVQISTANGRIEAPLVTLDSVDLSGARVTSVDAVVLPLEDVHNGEGLVGLNFLQHFKFELDAQHGVLRLSEKR